MPPYLPVPVIAVVGSRHSGKTATVEAIVKALTKKGYKTATAKHIHEPDFTIDTEGRDTWRHTKAGAHTTVAVAKKELAIIKKTDTTKLNLKDITKTCEDNTEIIILEGFRDLIAQDLTVPKIITVKNTQEINEATKTFKPILAFTTLSPQATFKETKTTPINIRTETQKLIQTIDKRIGPIITKRREIENYLSIDINGKTLPLNPYVQKVTRNVLLGIISTLKGANIKRSQNIQITITNPKNSHPNKATQLCETTQSLQKTTKSHKKQPKNPENNQIDEPKKGLWGLEKRVEREKGIRSTNT